MIQYSKAGFHMLSDMSTYALLPPMMMTMIIWFTLNPHLNFDMRRHGVYITKTFMYW